MYNNEETTSNASEAEVVSTATQLETRAKKSIKKWFEDPSSIKVSKLSKYKKIADPFESLTSIFDRWNTEKDNIKKEEHLSSAVNLFNSKIFPIYKQEGTGYANMVTIFVASLNILRKMGADI